MTDYDFRFMHGYFDMNTPYPTHIWHFIEDEGKTVKNKKIIELSEETLRRLADGECTLGAQLAAREALAPECVRWYNSLSTKNATLVSSLRTAYRQADDNHNSHVAEGIVNVAETCLGAVAVEYLRLGS